MIAALLLWACAAPPPPADALGWRASGVEVTLPAPEALAAGPLPIGPCTEASTAAPLKIRKKVKVTEVVSIAGSRVRTSRAGVQSCRASSGVSGSIVACW